MKVQIQLQSLRVRIDEHELAQLLVGSTLYNATRLPGGPAWSLGLALHEGVQPALQNTDSDVPVLLLPRAEVQALHDRLPSREGLQFAVGEADALLHLRFDVDVRDSVHQRGVARRSATASV